MIKFENVSKIYEDGFQALKNINLHIKKGELLVLIGPSGCGKTTTMKMINRLNDPTDGKIYVNGKLINEQDPVKLRRDIGYVIQQIGLFPHMTIAENVALVPKLKKENEEQYKNKVNDLLNMVGLDPEIYRDRYPGELSGGQQQRIGVIRALAAEPSIILMDEPFSALDPISREQLQEELVKLQKEINKTIVFVTHDMDEALKIADRICIMRDGEIVQLDVPNRILSNPADEFVKSFIGEDRLSQAKEYPELEDVIVKGITVNPTDKLSECIRLLHKNKINNLVVVDEDNKYLGAVASWDIYKSHKNNDCEIQEIMSDDSVKIDINQSFEEVLNTISKADFGFLPVTDSSNELRGVITNEVLIGSLADKIS
ncbi:betaine/proline/choline family ABC transporter ATP-binding protein [Oceanirhabdus seepicola]|uniref:Quaternary amine transport ATP-binding protein n=1 Tax=Oceanirhabdus seepicola TaxID=2828781 RepID=A0A9J6P5H4_9CLOT|nr:betaine/proline/choline family ABC transporter ATP-binding protein [Oceanirhabdus seepicola]MCM1991369.1 betaine/proline/choline family ABC transporter ATP-binding protein [Oceanirhabdus seepicola]